MKLNLENLNAGICYIDVMGTFNEVTMIEDGNLKDDAADDGIYGAQIPEFPVTTLVRC
jgi:hypothetical protein